MDVNSLTVFILIEVKDLNVFFVFIERISLSV
jgi:hypothetical protein